MRKKLDVEKQGSRFRIRTGQYLTWRAMERALKAKGVSIYDSTYNLLQKTEFSGRKRVVELVVTDTNRLGLVGAPFREIVRTARKQGLDLCTPEMAAHLRLVYQEQQSEPKLYEPLGISTSVMHEDLVVMHEPFVGTGLGFTDCEVQLFAIRSKFGIGESDGLALGHKSFNPEHEHFAMEQLVFQRTVSD